MGKETLLVTDSRIHAVKVAAAAPVAWSMGVNNGLTIELSVYFRTADPKASPQEVPVVNVLHCETACLGAQTVHEAFVPGESVWREPNLRIEYHVSAQWRGDTFVTVRRSDAVNGGRPCEQTRRVDASGTLVIRQTWGGAKAFTACYAKEQDAVE